MFFNNLTLNSYIQVVFKTVHLLYTKLSRYLEYTYVLLTAAAHATSTTLFFWKVSNYATANWFIYDRKLNNFMSSTFKL